MHFGRGTREVERANERDLIDCLEAHADEIQHLYLVGDVFDGYIEYRHLVPKGFVRFQALLARWTDRGIPVTYLFGNHDPWHRDYFRKEIGVRLVAETLDASQYRHRLHLAHGDAEASAHSSFSWARPLLRNPLAIRLYQSLLPADLAVGLARRVSRALYEPAPDPDVIQALEDYAQDQLCGPADVVILGHSHKPAFHRWAEGFYVNTGNWYEKRTFARLDKRKISLCRWNGTRALDIESAEL